MVPIVHVTGATGFLGWHVAESFRDQGWRVVALVRPGNTKPLPAGIESVEAALDGEVLARAVEGSSLIVHVAGLTHARSEAAFRAVNVSGTEAVVAAANSVGAPLLLISSQAAIGSAAPEQPSREDDDPRPLTAYGRSKLAAEAVVKSRARTPWMILRPSAVYGPRDRQFLPLFRLASGGWFPLAVNAAAAFTLIYVEDLARAVVLAAIDLIRAGEAGGAGGEVLFIGHPQSQTAEDVLRSLAVAYQRPYRPRRVPAALLDGLSWVGELSWTVGWRPSIDRARLTEFRASGFVCRVDRARDVLGFTATIGLSEGVELTARWYRDHGWL